MPLDETCVLIGENNTGKSSILEAIRICLTRPMRASTNIFEEYDYHLPDGITDPTTADPIEITLTFTEAEGGELRKEASQRLEGLVQLSEESLQVVLRVTSQYSHTKKDYITNHEFLGVDGLPYRATPPYSVRNLQGLVPFFYLKSLRDAAQEFNARSAFWKPFVRAFETDDDGKKELESRLSDINDLIMKNQIPFEQVKKKLKEMAELMLLSSSDQVIIEAVPTNTFEILSGTKVYLASRTNAKIPIELYGSGTQSLSVIGLFNAFLESRLIEKYGESAKPILALEEPEAHLHPAATKAVGEMLQNMNGQKIVSTHSGELLAGIPLKDIRRLTQKGGRVIVNSIMGNEVFNDDEIARLDYIVRINRGNLLFSRYWLLVEGASDFHILQACARKLGYDLYSQGISCIEYAGQLGVDKLIKFANEFGIKWFVIVDGDSEGEKNLKKVEDNLGEGDLADYALVIPGGPLEVLLCKSGHGHVYINTMKQQGKEASDLTAKPGTDEYWNQVYKLQRDGKKVENALLVAEQIMSDQGEVPEVLENTIEQVVELARQE